MKKGVTDKSVSWRQNNLNDPDFSLLYHATATVLNDQESAVSDSTSEKKKSMYTLRSQSQQRVM